MNYDKLMIEEISKLDYHPKLLLHSCCAPCSTAVIERLEKYFDLTIIYYNPNIEPKEEYLKRKEEQNRYLKIKNIPFMDSDYDNNLFQDTIKGLENEQEGGNRCSLCFLFRLEKTSIEAKNNNFDYFSTTLTVSPHKNSKIINEIGMKLSKKYKIKYLVNDFKKNEGYKKSIELAKENNLYRQDYCGCHYSIRK